jgi:cell filamentation protein
VRALWDEHKAKWWFSMLDVVAVLTDQDDYGKIALLSGLPTTMNP